MRWLQTACTKTPTRGFPLDPIECTAPIPHFCSPTLNDLPPPIMWRKFSEADLYDEVQKKLYAISTVDWEVYTPSQVKGVKERETDT